MHLIDTPSMIQDASPIVSSGNEYAGPNVTISTAASKAHKCPRSSHKHTVAPMAQLGFAVLQEFFKHCEVGDVCTEEDVVVDGRTHFHCLLCQAVVRSASKLQDHCMRHANAKSVPQAHEMCTKYFTRFMPTCSQNCQLSQTATKHRHCKLCGGAHTDPDSNSLGQHVERWHTRHYSEVKEIVDLARKLKNYLLPEENQQPQESESQQQQQTDVTMHVHGCQAGDIGQCADVSASMTQTVYTQGMVHPGSWQTSTTQMTDGSLATVHQWTGATPPVYPPNCTVQSMDQPHQPAAESYILQEHPVEPTSSQFVIQEAAAQSGVDESYTLQVETSSLNPSQEAASIILQMMDRVQMPENQPGLQTNHQPQPQPQQLPLIENETMSDPTSQTSPSNRKRAQGVPSDNTSPVQKLAKQGSTVADKVQIEISNPDSETLPLVFKSKPLPGTVIDPVSNHPKVWQHCLVCGSSSYLRTIRVSSEGNRRNMNKAQTARLMSFFKIAVDPTLPGKLICKNDFDTWLKFDKKLHQLLNGDDEKSQKASDGVMVNAKTPGRKPLGVAKKNKSVELSPPSHSNTGRRRPKKSSSRPVRVPRSSRLRERFEKQAAAQTPDDEKNILEPGQSQTTEGCKGQHLSQYGQNKQNREAATTQEESEQIVVVSVREDSDNEANVTQMIIGCVVDSKTQDQSAERRNQQEGNIDEVNHK